MTEAEPVVAWVPAVARRERLVRLLTVALALAAAAGCRPASEPESAETIAGSSHSVGGAPCSEGQMVITARRLENNPIIHPGLDPSIGTNIQGPSLIRVPDWIENPLGRYYLYFADHKGQYIRLAYADELAGPWRIYPPGTLQLTQSHFPIEPPPVPAEFVSQEELSGFAEDEQPGVPSLLENATAPHIASPDVHVREDLQQIVMYYHGLEAFRTQPSRLAVSDDGLRFEADPTVIGYPYLRFFPWQGQWYGLSMPGLFHRSPDGLRGTGAEGAFEVGPRLFSSTMRHNAVLLRGSTLFVFWTNVGDAPERIYVSRIPLDGDWMSWKESEPVEVVRPEEGWEGASLPIEPSYRSSINIPVNQLRDPAIYQEGDRVYLLYAVAGEAGIAIAELEFDCSGR